jgi:hypothetical protein
MLGPLVVRRRLDDRPQRVETPEVDAGERDICTVQIGDCLAGLPFERGESLSPIEGLKNAVERAGGPTSR